MPSIPHKKHWQYAFLQLFLGPILRVVWRMRISGARHMPASGPVIVVANHESQMDPFFLAAALDRQMHYVARGNLWRFRVLGRLLDGFGCIPIDRGSGDTDAMDAAINVLSAGRVIGIFPQGTILQTLRRPWRRGAARLALRAGATILPVALINTDKFARPWWRLFWPPQISVVIGEPIDVAAGRGTAREAEELTHRIEADVTRLRSSVSI